MAPFIVRDYGELRRQELLAAAAYHALLGDLSRDDGPKVDAALPRRLAVVARQAIEAFLTHRVRRESAVSSAGAAR